MCKKNLGNLLLVLSLGFLFIQPSFGQLAIIQDEDGYVNVRKEGSSQSKIVNRLFYGDVFLYLEEERENWYAVYFSLDKKDPQKLAYYSKIQAENGSITAQGYIHKSRVLPIDDLPDIATREIAGDKLILKNEFMDVSFHFRDFRKENHKVAYFEDNPRNVSSIDGKWARGVDGNLPTREIQLIKIFWDKQEIILPHEEYIDLYQPYAQGINLKEHKGYVYLTMFGNSDGAGGYDCVWIFKDGKYLRRYVNAP